MHLSFVVLWILSAAPAPAPAAAPTPRSAPLPSAKQVLDRYLEVTGGRAAYEKTRHRTLTGSFELKALGVTGTLLLQQSAPDKMVTRIDVPGLGSIVKGTDGVHAWEVSAAAGARTFTPRASACSLRAATKALPVLPETPSARA